MKMYTYLVLGLLANIGTTIFASDEALLAVYQNEMRERSDFLKTLGKIGTLDWYQHVEKDARIRFKEELKLNGFFASIPHIDALPSFSNQQLEIIGKNFFEKKKNNKPIINQFDAYMGMRELLVDHLRQQLCQSSNRDSNQK